jgi:cyclic pyranopterin phosphate synthase
MRDPFDRPITYLRLSVTDRCDFRCVYCMAEDMTFLPKAEILSLEELDRLAAAFIRLGVRKLRLTGGEPLVRRDIRWLIGRLGRHVATGALEELTLTTNGSQLAAHAEFLVESGMRRINVSLDTLDSARFGAITRWGRLEQVLAGIEAAKNAGLRVKINTVALKGVNEDEISRLIAWCGAEGFDLTLIEVMPLGELGGPDRIDQFLSLEALKDRLAETWTLEPDSWQSGGPARYFRIRETGGRLGLITPLSHNFCESCNRVRVTCTGTLFMCLGQEDAADLRAPLRSHAGDGALDAAIVEAISRKPRGHDFAIERRHAAPAVSRHMSVTGG